MRHLSLKLHQAKICKAGVPPPDVQCPCIPSGKKHSVQGGNNQILIWVSSIFLCQIFWNKKCRHLRSYTEARNKCDKHFCCAITLYLTQFHKWAKVHSVPSILNSVNSQGLYLAFHVIWLSRHQQGYTEGGRKLLVLNVLITGRWSRTKMKFQVTKAADTYLLKKLSSYFRIPK